ncbi:MAG: hypothetical protein ABI132_02595 [Rhodanobacteraceae bacterium]
MKTSTINRNAVTSRIFVAPHPARRLAIACAVLGAALVAQGAGAQYVKKYGNVQQAQPIHLAACPPGHGRNQYGQCVPLQRQPAKPPQPYEAKTFAHSSDSYTHVGKHHSPTPIYKARAQGFQGPAGPGPRHATGSSESKSGSHGIIFVGGHSSSRLDKAALNPQPIPPGHVFKAQAQAQASQAKYSAVSTAMPVTQMSQHSGAPRMQSRSHTGQIGVLIAPPRSFIIDNPPCLPHQPCTVSNMCSDVHVLPCQCGPLPGGQLEGCTGVVIPNN